MNLADEYINEKIKYGHWKDNAIRLCGNGAWSFTVMFLHMWSLLSNTDEPIQKYLPASTTLPLSDGWVQPYCDSPIDKEHVSEHVYSAIMEKAGIDSKAKAICFTLPVASPAGLRLIEDE